MPLRICAHLCRCKPMLCTHSPADTCRNYALHCQYSELRFLAVTVLRAATPIRNYDHSPRNHAVALIRSAMPLHHRAIQFHYLSRPRSASRRHYNAPITLHYHAIAKHSTRCTAIAYPVYATPCPCLACHYSTDTKHRSSHLCHALTELLSAILCRYIAY